MKTYRGLVGLGLFFFTAFTGFALAGTKSVQGTVTDEKGKPLSGAEVQAVRLDAKGPVFATKTDRTGQYTFQGLSEGAYQITASVNKVPKSVAQIRTRNDGWVRVDFDLRANAQGQKRYVWMKPKTGSNIGGKWVLEEEARRPGVSAMNEISDNIDLRKIQSFGAIKPVGFTGRPPGR